MKKYTTLGDLLKDFRKLNKISQSEMANRLNVDVRTLIRWENNETLIKPEKEEELVEETFIPYQLIRNLNANVAIPTFYDFRIRKYAYSELSNELPEAEWFRSHLNIDAHRSRPIKTESDLEHIANYFKHFYDHLNTIHKELILEAAKMFPQINQILFDTSGYYAGHCIAFPIKHDIYEKIRLKEITEDVLDSNCLSSIKPDEETLFYFYNITADCNENLFYVICPLLKYFQEFKGSYKIASYVLRPDGFDLVEQLGLKLVWEEENKELIGELEFLPRFYEGDFIEFLSRIPD
jgi:transcriptional regulator with XRE-family HTH domain